MYMFILSRIYSAQTYLSTLCEVHKLSAYQDATFCVRTHFVFVRFFLERTVVFVFEHDHHVVCVIEIVMPTFNADMTVRHKWPTIITICFSKKHPNHKQALH